MLAVLAFREASFETGPGRLAGLGGACRSGDVQKKFTLKSKDYATGLLPGNGGISQYILVLCLLSATIGVSMAAAMCGAEVWRSPHMCGVRHTFGPRGRGRKATRALPFERPDTGQA
jgi:hypothetical protein